MDESQGHLKVKGPVVVVVGATNNGQSEVGHQPSDSF